LRTLAQPLAGEDTAGGRPGRNAGGHHRVAHRRWRARSRRV
jgi:hypothetical protein